MSYHESLKIYKIAGDPPTFFNSFYVSTLE